MRGILALNTIKTPSFGHAEVCDSLPEILVQCPTAWAIANDSRQSIQI